MAELEKVPKVIIKERCVIGGKVYGKGTYENVPVDDARRIVEEGRGNIVAPAPKVTAPQAPPKVTGTAPTGPKKTATGPAKAKADNQPAKPAALTPALAPADSPQGEASQEQDGPDAETLNKLSQMTGPLPEGLPGREVYLAAGIEKAEVLITLDEQTLAELPGSSPELVAEGQQFLIDYVSK